MRQNSYLALVGMVFFAASAVATPGEPASRVRQARQRQGARVKKMVRSAGLPYPPPRLYIRVFKQQDQLELWGGQPQQPMRLIKTFAICARSGTLGPKRQRGDLQVPEGFYRLSRFNPSSSYHLSLKVSYPNALDRHFKSARDPGGDIYIHGDCVTIGCLPLQDGPIEELYLITWDHRQRYRRGIPVHVFPARMNDSGWSVLQGLARDDKSLLDFWRQLKPAYLYFEQHHRAPKVKIDQKKWRYRVRSTNGKGKVPGVITRQ